MNLVGEQNVYRSKRGRRFRPVPLESVNQAIHLMNSGISLRQAALSSGLDKSKLSRIIKDLKGPQ